MSSSSASSLPMGSLYLGLDAGTQSLKGVVVDAQRRVHCEAAVHYDSDLSEFGTRNGVCRADKTLCVRANDERRVVTAPSAIFLAALDLLLQRLRDLGVNMSAIVAVSGSGQQHGSVWWRHGSARRLQSLNPSRSLSDQLYDAFSLSHAPIWMDSSTTDECALLEREIGGAQALADISGSRAYERFTGNQIAKIASFLPLVYANTERISLISSAIASVLLGDYAAIDSSDAAGMNLMDLRSMQWHSGLLRIVVPANAPGEKVAPTDEIDIHMRLTLADRLGKIVPPHSILGRISSYFVERYGFAVDCRIVAFTGDNPASLQGLALTEPGDVAISLGTSDTLMAVMPSAAARPSGKEGHIFPHPSRSDLSMAMLCWKNGSLVRQHCRDHTLSPHTPILSPSPSSFSAVSHTLSSSSSNAATASASASSSGNGVLSSPNAIHRSHSASGARSPSLSSHSPLHSSLASSILWHRFNECLTRSALNAGNAGRLLFYYLEPEITPTTNASGIFRFNAQNEQVASFHDTLAPVPEFQQSRPSSPSLSPSRSPSIGSSHLFHPSPWQTAEIRALIDTQFLSMRFHAKQLGLDAPRRIVAIGGAASNTAILQAMADVFQCAVYTYRKQREREIQRSSSAIDALNAPKDDDEAYAVNAAAIGGAFRALEAMEHHAAAGDSGSEMKEHSTTKANGSAEKGADGITRTRSAPASAPLPDSKRARHDSLSAASSSYSLELLLVARPRGDSAAVYEKMLSRYGECEAKVIELVNSPHYSYNHNFLHLSQRRSSSPSPLLLNSLASLGSLTPTPQSPRHAHAFAPPLSSPPTPRSTISPLASTSPALSSDVAASK